MKTEPNQSLIPTIGALIVMLIVAPLVATTTLVCCHPDWGGGVEQAIFDIPIMALFGLITVPLWPTYIPAIVLTPLMMRRVAAWQSFHSTPLPVVILFSMIIGSLFGVLILAPVIVMSIHHNEGLYRDWIFAGAVSGAVTLTCICVIHRRSGPG